MRDRITVTLTSIRGSRHYSLTAAARRGLLAAVAGLVVVLLAGGGTIFWLHSEIDRLAARKAQLHSEQAELEQEREALLAAVARKSEELESAGRELAGVNERLGEIEVMIGLREAPATTDSLQSRLDSASQTLHEKLAMLQQIPSGSPIPEHGVTSDFGWRVHPVTGERAFHDGIDLRAERGAPVHATADGVVEWAAMHRSSGLGKLIILRHNFGFRTFFAHLDSVAVAPGDYVQRGDVIGRVGSTGLSNGPHLHYEVRYIHRKFDPVPFMEWNLANYDALFTREDGVQWDSLAHAVKRQLHSGVAPQLSLRAPEFRAN
jgi:murein DD-endopeptidase MepM/ murein hydrolase activator NlpD